MKTIKTLFTIITVVLLFPKNLNAQQLFHVHEDVVKPSMSLEYENTLADIYKLIEEFPLEDLKMLVLQGSNNHYFFVEPIGSMADLDKPSPLIKLAEKAGRDKIMALINRLDKCYDVERDYVIRLNNELSYMPNGITQTPEGQNYREQYKIYYSPENRQAVRDQMKAVKAMFTEKKSNMHYRVYQSEFGTEAEYYLVSVAAKDELDMAEKGKAHEELVGEDGKKMMWELFQKVLKIEEIEGEMRPDLSSN